MIIRFLLIILSTCLLLSCSEDKQEQKMNSNESNISDSIKPKIIKKKVDFRGYKVKFKEINFDTSGTCQDWAKRVDIVGYQSMFRIAKPISKSEFMVFDKSECRIYGNCSVDSVEYQFEINSANWIKVVHPDTVIYMHTQNIDLYTARWAAKPNIKSEFMEIIEISSEKYKKLKQRVAKTILFDSIYFSDENKGYPSSLDSDPAVLKLFCKNDTLAITDVHQESEEMNLYYNFAGKIDSLNMYMVSVHGWEWGEYQFYDCETCKPVWIRYDRHEYSDKNTLGGYSYFSQDFTKCMEVENDTYSEEYSIVTHIDFYKILPNRKFNHIEHVEILGNYFNGIEDAFWISDNEILVYSYSGWNDGDGRGTQESKRYFNITLKGIY